MQIATELYLFSQRSRVLPGSVGLLRAGKVGLGLVVVGKEDGNGHLFVVVVVEAVVVVVVVEVVV